MFYWQKSLVFDDVSSFMIAIMFKWWNWRWHDDLYILIIYDHVNDFLFFF